MLSFLPDYIITIMTIAYHFTLQHANKLKKYYSNLLSHFYRKKESLFNYDLISQILSNVIYGRNKCINYLFVYNIKQLELF